MSPRFPNQQNQLGSRLLSNVDDLTIHASKTDDGAIVRYQLSGGVNYDMEPGDEKQATEYSEWYETERPEWEEKLRAELDSQDYVVLLNADD